MSTVAAVITRPTGISSYGRIITWTPLIDANRSGDAQAVADVGLSITILISGTHGGSTTTIHGSMDGTNFYALSKMDGTAASVTADGFLSLSDLPLYIKPVNASGSSVSVTVVAFIK